MADAITIELTDKAKATLSHLQTLPDWGLKAVANGLQLENALTVSHIQQDHLTGRGPFPPEMHKLGVRSGRLRQALLAIEPTISGQVVTSAIGDNVVYAAIHEFGGRIVRKPYSGTVKLRTDRHGILLRQSSHPHLAIFARKTHKQVKEVSFSAEGYEFNMPERAPVCTGIQERLQEYELLISRELVAAWKEEGQ